MRSMEGFGVYLRNRRIELGLTLREFCRQTDENPGNVSKIERGKLAPPDSIHKLQRYAKTLQIEDTDEMHKFIDLASISRGELPEDIVSETEIAKILPLVFRTLRGEEVDQDKLKELAELIRKQ